MDEERQEDDDQGKVPGEHYGEGDHVQGVQADGGGLGWVRAQLKEQGGSQHPHLQAHCRWWVLNVKKGLNCKRLR